MPLCSWLSCNYLLGIYCFQGLVLLLPLTPASGERTEGQEGQALQGEGAQAGPGGGSPWRQKIPDNHVQPPPSQASWFVDQTERKWVQLRLEETRQRRCECGRHFQWPPRHLCIRSTPGGYRPRRPCPEPGGSMSGGKRSQPALGPRSRPSASTGGEVVGAHLSFLHLL